MHGMAFLDQFDPILRCIAGMALVGFGLFIEHSVALFDLDSDA